MRVIITAGGTGGHIYPALAIINKIKEREANSSILYIGTTDRMEATLVPRLDINYVGIEIKGIDRKNIFNNIKVYLLYRNALKKCEQVIKDFAPDVVVGVGGYVTVPVLTVAHKLGIKTLIHEQNSVPGVSNRRLSRIVDKVCVSLPDSVAKFGGSNIVYTGNPRSEEIKQASPADKKKFGLSDKKKLVLIVMGSLGSTTMTVKIRDLIGQFKNKNYQVIIITGKNYFTEYQNIKTPSNVAIVSYLDDFINLLKRTDLIVSRAGASTIAEITAIGLPSILVPSPYVTHNHQLMNALELEHVGACKIIEEKNFNKETVIKTIDEILNSPGTYRNMQLASKSLGITDSATKIYLEIKKLAGSKNDR